MRQLAFKTLGSLLAGNINSSQLAIIGSDLLLASYLGGLTPIFASGQLYTGCT
jgi:hypothetical protein